LQGSNPRRSNTCEQRNVIDCMFCRFKDWCSFATGFDGNIKTFLKAVTPCKSG
jgi:transposase